MEEKICFGNTTHTKPTNSDRCIICQKETHTNLQKVRSVESLRYAVTQRQDSIARRLEHIVTSDSQNDKNIYWHGDGRRWYSLKKSCDLAAKRRQSLIGQEDSEQPGASSDNTTPSTLTRSKRSVLDYKCARSPSRHARRRV